jgi:hypothetical protein
LFSKQGASGYAGISVLGTGREPFHGNATRRYDNGAMRQAERSKINTLDPQVSVPQPQEAITEVYIVFADFRSLSSLFNLLATILHCIVLNGGCNDSQKHPHPDSCRTCFLIFAACFAVVHADDTATDDKPILVSTPFIPSTLAN